MDFHLPAAPHTHLGRIDELFQELLDWIADGKHPKQWHALPGKPSSSETHRWRQDYVGFETRYQKAVDAFCESIVLQVLEIADDGSGDRYVDEETLELQHNEEAIARSRLRVDARLRSAAMLSRRMGKQTIAVGGDPEAPPVQLEDREVEAKVVAIFTAIKNRVTAPAAVDPAMLE